MDKNSIKQFFRNGSRPTQDHFYSLIDACYNENYSVYVSGYELKIEEGEHSQVKSVRLNAGEVHVVPWFERINIPESRTYHYTLPTSNLGPGFRLVKISMNLNIPGNKVYEAKDEGSNVQITQNIQVNSINIYNGSNPILELTAEKIPSGNNQEILLNITEDKWYGISVDIRVDYEIKSDIAVSDQFDLTRDHASELTHVFGGLGIEFNTAEG